jgi:DNA-binding NarL/FixJ family response regulator
MQASRDCGASGFISKEFDSALLANAIKLVEAGAECFLANEKEAGQDKASEFNSLTLQLSRSKKAIFDLIISGYSDKEIAGKISKTPGHISNVASEIYNLFGVKKREHLILAATAAGYYPHRKG